MNEVQTFGIDDVVHAIYEEMTSEGQTITKKVIKEVIKKEKELIARILGNGDRVRYLGHGTYEARYRDARPGRHPQTGETITLEGRYYPAFKPGKALKEAVK